MARKILRLAIFLVIANALYRFVPVYFHYQQFKDAVHETALFSRGRTDAQIIDRVMELAAKYQVPLDREPGAPRSGLLVSSEFATGRFRCN